MWIVVWKRNDLQNKTHHLQILALAALYLILSVVSLYLKYEKMDLFS